MREGYNYVGEGSGALHAREVQAIKPEDVDKFKKLLASGQRGEYRGVTPEGVRKEKALNKLFQEIKGERSWDWKKFFNYCIKITDIESPGEDMPDNEARIFSLDPMTAFATKIGDIRSKIEAKEISSTKQIREMFEKAAQKITFSADSSVDKQRKDILLNAVIESATRLPRITV